MSVKRMGAIVVQQIKSRVLGILGGMGPAATAEFLRLIAEGAPAGCDQDHPKIVMISDPSIPDRTRAIMGDGESPLPYLKAELERLVSFGADFLAIPCNTAHVFVNLFRKDLKAELVHIVEETVKAAMKRAPKGAWLLSTSGTRASGIYPDYAKSLGYVFREPPLIQQEVIQKSLSLVKAGRLKEAGEFLSCAIKDLWAEEDMLVVTACTELPLAYAAAGLPKEREISSLQALSDACLRHIYPEEIL